MKTNELRIVGATLDEIEYEFVGGPRDGARIVAPLPHGVLLPPRPTPPQVVEAFAEWADREAL